MGMKEMLPEILCMILAVLVIGGPVIWILTRKTDKKHLMLLGFLFLVIWGARAWLGFQDGFYATLESEPVPEPGVVEKIFNSFLHALQTFSMDVDYAKYTQFGATYLEKTFGFKWLPDFYILVISVLNACAVVMGGAVVLDVLLDFFPGLRIGSGRRRHKFVFSELNDDAIALAEDVVKERKYKELITMNWWDGKPMVIFANAGQDARESSPELYSRARNIGAICVKRDVLQLKLKSSKSVNYFLIDQDAHANISTLDQLLEPVAGGTLRWPMMPKWKKPKRKKSEEQDSDQKEPDGPEPRTRIFVFGQDDSGNALVRRICAEHEKISDHVTVRPILDRMNAALNLMYEVPLFLPLLSKGNQDRGDIHLTILGSGALAEEVLKAGYWCGQIYGVKLHVNVLAPDAAQMEKRIEELCPEMLAACDPNWARLQIHPHDTDQKKNPPYCATMKFHEVPDLAMLSAYPGDILKKTDYYVVALDTDARNLQVADLLKAKITRDRYLSGETTRPVIAPAVEDQRIAQAAQILAPEAYGPYVTPFASRESRYSCKNVFLTSFTERNISIKSLYRKENHKNDQGDPYKTQSSAARAVHAPYKLFGMGVLKQVDLTEDIATRYKISQKVSQTEEQENQFAWVEHRRWNAYMRTQGFRCPTKEQYDCIFAQTGETKSIPLKLHPCLVEGQVERKELKVLDQFVDPEYDYLDYVSMYTYRMKCEKSAIAQDVDTLHKKDYKNHDYLKKDAGVTALIPKDDPKACPKCDKCRKVRRWFRRKQS